VMIANAATYGLIGLMVEALRRQLHHARWSAHHATLDAGRD
jgi:hypothetical protein